MALASEDQNRAPGMWIGPQSTGGSMVTLKVFIECRSRYDLELVPERAGEQQP
jgi:hypothetical protein